MYVSFAPTSSDRLFNRSTGWNGGRLATCVRMFLFEGRPNHFHRVCITAVWPSFNTLPNRLPVGMYTTTSEFVGFIVFWCLTLPLLWIHPEKFRRPFQFISIYTGVAFLSVREFYPPVVIFCRIPSLITSLEQWFGHWQRQGASVPFFIPDKTLVNPHGRSRG